jgi:SNF2 family DNA or RNA helicase
LPDGQIAQIPQAWFYEYRSFLDVCIVKDDSVRLSHYHVSAIAELEQSGKLKAGLKDRFRMLLEQEAPADYDLPQNFGAELRPYQIIGYRWLRLLDELNLGACLADDMGLGKTIQTLTLLLWLKEQNRRLNLLVVPTSLVFNWMNEISKFCPSLKVYIHTGPDRMREGKFDVSFDIIITSYAILRRDKEMFAENNFGYVILDEAQAIKNAGADIFRTVISLKAQRFLTLTGTPLENSFADLWSQMHFVNRGILSSLKDFNSRMLDPDYQSRVAMLIKPFILRRTKAQVLTDLPEKQIFTEYCEMSDDHNTFYKELRNTIRERFLGDKEAMGKLNAIVVLEGLLRLRQAANHPVLVDKEYSGFSGKFDSVITKLHEVMAQNAKVLIFSSFVEHLAIYKRYLVDNNISFCYIDGSTKDREAEVNRFQNDENSKVFLLSLKAGGIGLNLTAASYVFLLDPWWNPAVEAQAADRAHRIGQKNAVFVYRFISAGSIEEKILNLQKNKLEMFDKMIGETPDDFKITNAEDVLSLLD